MENETSFLIAEHFYYNFLVKVINVTATICIIIFIIIYSFKRINTLIYHLINEFFQHFLKVLKNTF